MSKEYYLKGMKKLMGFFPQNDFGLEDIENWYEYFSEYNEKEFKIAIEEYIKKEFYFPKVATLRKKIEDLKPSKDEKAREFESKLFSCSTDNLIKHFEKIDDKVALKVIKRNYDTMRNTMIEDIGMVKAQMREQYKNISSLEQKEEIQSNYLNANLLTENEKKVLDFSDNLKF